MLYTNLNHIETAADYFTIIGNNENVMVVCGRMTPSCIQVYRIAEELEMKHAHIKFYDMEFDNPESGVLKNVVEYYNLESIPLVGYFKKGDLVEVSIGAQTKEQISTILNTYLKLKENESKFRFDN